MTAFRPVFAAALLAVLLGGAVLPVVHEATHGAEAAAAQAEHVSTFHGDAGDDIQAPCAPSLHDVDCAVCAGSAAAVDLVALYEPLPGGSGGAVAGEVDWVRTVTAAGAGARAPPIG